MSIEQENARLKQYVNGLEWLSFRRSRLAALSEYNRRGLAMAWFAIGASLVFLLGWIGVLLLFGLGK